MTGRGRGEAAEDGRRDGGDGRDHGRQARYASHALVSPLDLGSRLLMTPFEQPNLNAS